jgi:aldose 1-epimerase
MFLDLRNLDAYASSESASKHFLQLNASQYIAVDPILVPTGALQPVKDTPLDFTEATEIGSRLNQTLGLCGEDCIGYVSAKVQILVAYTYTLAARVTGWSS